MGIGRLSLVLQLWECTARMNECMMANGERQITASLQQGQAKKKNLNQAFPSLFTMRAYRPTLLASV